MPEKPDIKERIFARKSLLAQAVDRVEDGLEEIWDHHHRLQGRVATTEANVDDLQETAEEHTADYNRLHDRIEELERDLLTRLHAIEQMVRVNRRLIHDV